MSFLKNILGSIMSFFYNGLKNLGPESSNSVISHYAIAILLMAVVNKLITIPMSLKQGKQMEKMAKIGPKLEEVKKKYGYDEQVLNTKIREVYQEENVSPLGGNSCLMTIIQFIIVIALYDVIQRPEVYIWHNLSKIEILNVPKNFFWIKDLQLKDPTRIVAILNSLTQLGTAWLMQQSRPKNTVETGQNAMASQMYIMPIIFFFIFERLASGIVLYWAFGNVLEMIIRGIIYLANKRKLQFDYLK